MMVLRLVHWSILASLMIISVHTETCNTFMDCADTNAFCIEKNCNCPSSIYESSYVSDGTITCKTKDDAEPSSFNTNSAQPEHSKLTTAKIVQIVLGVGGLIVVITGTIFACQLIKKKRLVVATRTSLWIDPSEVTVTQPATAQTSTTMHDIQRPPDAPPTYEESVNHFVITPRTNTFNYANSTRVSNN